jgi:hypothetical protein
MFIARGDCSKSHNEKLPNENAVPSEQMGRCSRDLQLLCAEALERSEQCARNASF